MTKPAVPSPEIDDRRRRLLDAAFVTFARFGFRKTSMEEVAQAAQLSRQGLYLHFSTKEDLFRAVVRHALATGLADAAARLEDEEATLEQRLIGGFDEWVGRYVGVFGADVTDIGEASALLLGRLVPEHEERFLDLVIHVIKGSRLAAAYRTAGLNSRQLAETLHATARGLKHDARSRDDFRKRMEVAVKALCAMQSRR